MVTLHVVESATALIMIVAVMNLVRFTSLCSQFFVDHQFELIFYYTNTQKQKEYSCNVPQFDSTTYASTGFTKAQQQFTSSTTNAAKIIVSPFSFFLFFFFFFLLSLLFRFMVSHFCFFCFFVFCFFVTIN